MPDAAHVESLPALAADSHQGWRAQLSLAFTRTGSRTWLSRRTHVGPLVVQKPFYPEGDEVCQCIIVHPPGGIAGGDSIELQADVGAGAHVQLTTPGATKWYRAAGRRAAQSIAFEVAQDAILEWCPQSTIVFDGADAKSNINVQLRGNARYIGWDTVCLGRTASDERFGDGLWRQSIDIERDDALVWSERASVRGASRLLSSPVGLNAAPVFGTFVAVPFDCNPALLAECRDHDPLEGEGAVTCIGDVLIARYRGKSSEAAHAYFITLWSVVRPRMMGRVAVVPRIWRT